MTFIVEFYHAYFGWLDYDHEFPNHQSATDWMHSHPSPYKQRVRRIH